MNKYFLPVYHSELKPWIKWWILKRLNGGQSSLKAVTISSGTLTKVDKSKALSIKEYYGNTVQNGTPSPQSPVEIQTISGDNTFTINGNSYRVDLGGKNKLSTPMNITNRGVAVVNDINSYFSFNGTGTGGGNINNTSNTFTLNAGTYTFSIRYKSGTLTTAGASYIRLRSSSGDAVISGAELRIINTNYNSEVISATFTITETTTMYLSVYIVNTTVYDNLVYEIQLEKGTVATPYSPYVANPIELCKIGDYKDKIYNDNGTWKVEKNIGKVVLNGSETIQLTSTGSNYTRFNVTIPNIILGNTSTYTLIKSNYYYSKYAIEPGVIFISSTRNICSIIHNSVISLNDYKTWLGTNNVTVYYVLATPTTETITNTNLISGLNALYEFYVNSSTVSISNNSEIPLEVLLEYYGR